MAGPNHNSLPALPATPDQFIEYVAQHPHRPMSEILEPYKQYESHLRNIYAQQPDHSAISESHVVPVFAGHEGSVRTRQRHLEEETEEERQRYIMPLTKDDRRLDKSPAIVESLEQYRANFAVFSESSLVEMDWSNVCVAGSAALTPLLPVPKQYAESKRGLREYYHEKIAPASDVDLFLYGLTEDQAVEKIKQIERLVRDSLLEETTTIRTKNTITIVSQYPHRHVQIVLRIYRSISEILAGFDVDCSCCAYDGKQVYASPRALAACMTQTNTVDLSRRSPSYENRLSKYSHRGFEIYWPLLDRTRIDPTIFERSFQRTLGLARLLVLEKLPKIEDREAYTDQRRRELGRPMINRSFQRRKLLRSNIKDQHNDEVPDFLEENEISNYHTFNIPYGPRYNARKIEKLLYKKDLLLNAEWNKPKDREVNLHRHPAFFGSAEDVMRDCCGYCPKPVTPEEKLVAEEESRQFISGDVTFIKDDPGRQAIGSFNPLTDDDWTEMAYVGNTENLCRAIADKDLEYVRDWLSKEESDPNRRDYTGRTPLHLAVMESSVEIVQYLIDHGARIVARLADGKTALHLAAMRGEVDIVKALLCKSDANEEEEERKKAARREAGRVIDGESALGGASSDAEKNEENINISTDPDGGEAMDDGTLVETPDEDPDVTTERSYVRIDAQSQTAGTDLLDTDDAANEPDIYDVDVLAWDLAASPLHYAIINGRIAVVKCLVQDFGASVTLPVKLYNDWDRSARAAILPLLLATCLPLDEAMPMVETLLDLGASPAQGDFNQVTTLNYFALEKAELLDIMLRADKPGVGRAVNHIGTIGSYNASFTSPLAAAISAGNEAVARRLLEAGADPEVRYAAYLKALEGKSGQLNLNNDAQSQKERFQAIVCQPIITAVNSELPTLVTTLIDYGADINTLTPDGWAGVLDNAGVPREKPESLLDTVRAKIEKLKNFSRGNDEEEKIVQLVLNGDVDFFEGVKQGTYSHWAIKLQVEHARKHFLHEENTRKHRESTEAERTGLNEKLVAVNSLLEQFINLELELVKRGAKTIQEMHSKVKEHYPHANIRHRPVKEQVWKPSLSFRAQDATDEREQAYLRLFEAAWEGDIATIKTLTLTVWDDGNSPLKVSVLDKAGFSPFWLAIARGHLHAAKAILEIVRLQYSPKDETARRGYFLQHAASDDGDSDAGSDMEIASEIIDDQFTVENIGEVHLQVNSQVKPLELMSWPCPHVPSQIFSSRGMAFADNFDVLAAYKTASLAGRTLPATLLAPELRPFNLFQLAIYLNDQSLLSFLLDLAEWHTLHSVDHSDDSEEEPPSSYEFSKNDLTYAMQLGRIEIMSQIIQRTGCGLYWSKLANDDDEELHEKPKYYQGLSVRGQKRADWARRDRHTEDVRPNDSPAPLLEAALKSDLSAVEWFLGDTPERMYLEFASAHQDDKRFKQLKRTSGDLITAVGSSLDHNSHLLLHYAILGKTSPKSLQLIEYIIDTQPLLLEARTLNGQSPLHLAFALIRPQIARLLISKGADQTARDKSGATIIHALLKGVRSGTDSQHVVSKLFGLLDPSLLVRLFSARSAESSYTPLSTWLHRPEHGGFRTNKTTQQNCADIVTTILRYSKGVELEIIDEMGNTPLHTAIKDSNAPAAKAILAVRPDLLWRENTNGRTPLEVANDIWSAQVFDEPPKLPLFAQQWGYFRNAHVDIVDKQPETFVDSQEEKFKGGAKEEVWRMCQAHDAEFGPRKRKLVTLAEANEVAKRLDRKQTQRKKYERSRRRHRSRDDEQERDDVESRLQFACKGEDDAEEGDE